MKGMMMHQPLLVSEILEFGAGAYPRADQRVCPDSPERIRPHALYGCIPAAQRATKPRTHALSKDTRGK